jgi:DNA-binding response OmpR family regulator
VEFSVLLVEDNPAERRFMRRALERFGLRMLSAQDGAEGMALAQEQRPDAIILDLNLPDINGLMVMRLLKADSRTAKIPVVCLTGEPDPAKLLRTASMGLRAESFLYKPIDAAALHAHILTLLGRESQKRAAGASLERGDFRRRTDEKRADPYRYLRRGALVVDILRRCASLGGRPLPFLTGHRFDVLCALVRANDSLSREELLQEVWGGEQDLGSVSVTISRLREDLEPFPSIQILSSRDGYTLAVK